MKKVAYVLSSDPNDKRSWSGTCFSTYEQLKRHYDVDVYIIKEDIIDKLWGIIIRNWMRITRKCIAYKFTKFYTKRCGKKVEDALRGKKYDAAFFIGTFLLSDAKHLDIPKVLYYTDATFNNMLNYYAHGLSRLAQKQGDKIHKDAMTNATHNLFASEWAINSAINYYGIPAEKCHLARVGANVDTSDFKKKLEEDTINLLFVGVEWGRKGGDIAVECIRYLTKTDKEHKYVLHLVGVQPPYDIPDENIKVYGFLNRNIPEQKQLMIELREKANLFVLPTQAECAGIVFGESSAYGIPSITFDTGGIGSYVTNGENGYRLPMGSKGKDFAEKIMEIVNDKETLEYMQKRCKEIYKEKLNWDCLGDKIKSIIG